MSYDAIVVGGGLIGGSIAFDLARHRQRVLLLDRQQPGLEASWAAAGMLAPAPEAPEARPLVPLAKASFALYPAFVAAVQEASGRDVGFHTGPALQLFLGPEAEKELGVALALLRQVQLEAEALPFEEARRLEPHLNPDVRAAALLRNEGRVNNRALTEAVLRAAALHGTEIRAGAEVRSLILEGGRCTGVTMGQEKIPADWVVIAAGCYSGKMEVVACYGRTRPVRGQMIALRPADGSLRHVLRSHHGYLVPRDDGRIVAGSTLEDAGFEKRVTPAGLQQILKAAVELVPVLESAAVLETWSGLRPDTPDHLPILGPTDVEGLLVATGHYRNGILLAPVTAQLVREWITMQKPSVETEGFSPLRFLEKKREAAR